LEFASAFTEADYVIVTDIYQTARELKDNSISSKMLVTIANKYKNNAIYSNNTRFTLRSLKEIVKKNDIIITMGAGDIYLLHDQMKKILN
jgi:UDP-N-acetylmuramate--alanine ligase